jgi:hypothetical protein
MARESGLIPGLVRSSARGSPVPATIRKQRKVPISRIGIDIANRRRMKITRFNDLLLVRALA